MKSKKSVFKRFIALGAAAALSLTLCAGCNKKSGSKVDYNKYDIGVVKALNAVSPSLGGNVLSQTAVSDGNDKYLVTVITDETVSEYVVDGDFTVEQPRDVLTEETTSDSSTDSTGASPDVSATEPDSTVTPDVSGTEPDSTVTPDISATDSDAASPDISASESDTTTAAPDSTQSGSDTSATEPNPPTGGGSSTDEPIAPQKTDLERAYEAAVSLAGIDTVEIVSFDFDKSTFMGIAALEIELKTKDGKYSFVLRADDLSVLSSSLKLNSGKQEAAGDTSYIGEELAKGIALNAAGVKNEADAAKLKVTENRSNGNKVYKVRFDFSGYHYDATIDAVSGKIVKFSKEILADVVVSEAIPAVVTVEEAKKAALAFVFPDLTDYSTVESAVKKVKLDYEDGAFVYEIEIIYEGKEYEIEISAENAAIVDADIDDDNDHDDDHDDHDDDHDDDDDDDDKLLGTGYITEDEAKNAVLAVCGEGAIVTDIEVETEGKGENKTFYYEIEVKVAGKKHEYLVNAVTGEVTDKHGTPVGEPTATITEAQALQIALQHYSVTESEAKVHKVKLHKGENGGANVYEVKFSVKNLNYTVVVNAETGEVVKSDKLFD